MGKGGTIERRKQIVELRRQLHALEVELGAVDDAPEVTDPRTLLARERLLTEAERIVHIGSWAWHVASNSVHWSDEMFRIFGVAPDTTDLFAAFAAGIHPDDRARMQESQARLVEHGSVEPTELRVVRPDGTERIVRADSAAVLDENGKPSRFVGTIHDLTELRTAEVARRRHEEMLRAGEALAGVASFRWVLATNEVVWSAQMWKLTGLPSSATPSVEQFLALVHAEDRARVEAALQRAQAARFYESLPARIVRVDGEQRDVIIEGGFVEDDTEMLGSVLDVTELRRLQGELFQAQKLEALGRLAGGIAHDFNNILAVLRLALETPELRNTVSPLALRDITHAIDQGVSLTGQLLAFGRRSALRPEATDVGELLQRSVSMVARLLGDAVTARLVPVPEGLVVHVDPAQLQHTLINLLVNARDAMPNGGTITLRARAVGFDAPPANVSPALAPGDYIELEVEDQGTGIDVAIMPYIFEPFFTTKETGKGTGLGLASVFGTVSQSGGATRVLTRTGSGTTFQLFLPRVRTKPTHASPGAVAPGVRKARVLVVDDHPTLGRMIKIILDDAGYEVELTPHPDNVADHASKVAVAHDLVVTDVDMPGTSGPQLAARLWAHAPTLPVLFMSGHAQVEPITDASARHALLRKPFAGDELLRAIAELLGPTER